jgi:hypothetical protein
MAKKILKMFGVAILLIWGGVFVVTFAWAYFMVSAHNAEYDFKYSPGIFGTGIFKTPRDRFQATCGWEDMIEGDCDIKDSDGLLNKEEIAWIMEREKVSREKIIEHAKRRIEYNKERNKIGEERGFPIQDSDTSQIIRLENIIKILKEE